MKVLRLCIVALEMVITLPLRVCVLLWAIIRWCIIDNILYDEGLKGIKESFGIMMTALTEGMRKTKLYVKYGKDWWYYI